ncbi:lysozyme inhibitor LprI family protein [Burkholderia lata]|uniref:PF07007 family protein n=1 Tax=Burkholderia lata (strain ATCC 17760 / DSM 23089 / LMG 22485 / NCIMB 9086 / R18194 / 383) TaxID=482957 RepID=A0A6P2I1T6_BURL3|nr:lysozyme inhibitor LprI family protein [Burkholderia lata]VWB24508.1 PF07007 family protein [Burkholderia lata]
MQNTQNRPIWNPSTAAGLSVLLTPAFGSYLHASNWRTLGQLERAAASKVWFYVSLLILAAMGFVAVGLVGKAGPDKDAIRGAVNIGGLVYFVVWYVLSGRKQVSYVREQLGKTYAKKSLAKPLLVTFACVIAYAAAIFGLLVATHGGAVNGAATDQSSGGSPFSLASLFGSGNKLDCAAPNVKQYVIDAYGTDPLMKTSIPDLVWALRDNRIKIHVDAIRETARNDESKNIDCAASFVIDFPKDDLERAQQQDAFGAVMLVGNHTPVSDATFTAAITYQVATSSDAAEQKNGPIVTLTTEEDRRVDKLLKTYAMYYEVLSLSGADITANSKNATSWDKTFKDNAIQSCSKTFGVERCTCRISELEKIVPEKDMWRFGFAQQAGGMFANRYVNLNKVVQTLGQQCPMTQSVASIVGDQGAVSNVPAPTVATPMQDSAATPVGNATQREAAPPAQTPIVASFDCAKAASKVEKLICSSTEAATADKQLAAVYRATVAKSSDPAALKQQQRDWLKERNACDDAACLVRVTDARIQALSAP